VARGAPPVAARQAAMLGYAILAIPLLGVLGVPTLWGTVLLLGVGIAAHQGFSVNLFALITDVVPTARVGTVTSLGAFCGNLAGMAELWWLGQVLARGGSYAPFLNGSALVFLLALAWIYWLLPRVQPS
jgi:ACS family hexuronate transporter-like MFS transporter